MPFSLKIPVDASEVDDRDGEQSVKIAVVSAAGDVVSKVVELDDDGKGSARIKFDEQPGSVRVVVGPPDASDEEIVNLQTLTRQVSARLMRGESIDLEPILIPPFYWRWWRRWCRNFTVSGRVMCPDGSPVPGATVCASDVDWWWWWSSSQQVGCAQTDANGVFTISFRWCCGWWPWWWWRLRSWRLEPELVHKIKPVLDRVPDLQLPVPSPVPRLDLFEGLLSGEPPFSPRAVDLPNLTANIAGLSRNPAIESRALPNVAPAARNPASNTANLAGNATRALSREIDPAVLPDLREELLRRLPRSPELERLRIWPWWRWTPWWDCTPDIIFNVTQDCVGEETLIVDESVWDARWDIPTNLDVTLTANSEACCVSEPPPPEGNCLVLASVCSQLVDQIGGNPGAAPMPAGYLNPGLIATAGDRPYAGTVPIHGLFGDAANIDYYEFEIAQMPGGPWTPLPPAAAGGFKRVYWGPQLGGGPVDFHAVSFPFSIVDGRLVAESREHFEANNEPATWGSTRYWVSNRDLLIRWLTDGNVADQTHYLRLVGYELTGGNLGQAQILRLCNTDDDNGVVITTDNVTSDLEPAADIADVRINGSSAGPCSNIDASGGGVLEVDFVAYDVGEHLAQYTLIATYGDTMAVNLLNATGAVLSPVPLGSIPAADFEGPDYGAARGQGAIAPAWRGGGLRLTIPDLRHAFPETCCYQIELRVYKRSIVSCNTNYTPWKLTYHSLTVVV